MSLNTLIHKDQIIVPTTAVLTGNFNPTIPTADSYIIVIQSSSVVKVQEVGRQILDPTRAQQTWYNEPLRHSMRQF